LTEAAALPALDAVFSALSDPTRRAIVARLAVEREATVLDLAEPFDMSLPAVSKHLKVLEQAGLLNRGKAGQSRPCSLRIEALVEAAQWVDHTRQAWEARLDRMTAYVEETHRKRVARRKD